MVEPLPWSFDLVALKLGWRLRTRDLFHRYIQSQLFAFLPGLILIVGLGLGLNCVGAAKSGPGRGVKEQDQPKADIFCQEPVFWGEVGLKASVPIQPSCSYSWTIQNGASAATIQSAPDYPVVTFRSGDILGTFTLAAEVANGEGRKSRQQTTVNVTGNIFLKRPKEVMPTCNSTLTPLLDGRVLKVGGTSMGSLLPVATVELFDPFTRNWRSLAPLSTPRVMHSATRLKDGRVLIAGGMTLDGNKESSSVEIFDPKILAWTVGPPLTTPRQLHSATLLNNSKVMIVGGSQRRFVNSPEDPSTEAVATTEIFDPDSAKWSSGASMRFPREAHSATILSDGRVLVAGGEFHWVSYATTEIYDPVLDQWQPAGSMVSSHSHHAAIRTLAGDVFLAGGRSGSETAQSTCEIYSPQTDTWKSAGTTLVPRSQPTVTELLDGGILIAGGTDYQNAEIFYPANFARTKTGPLTLPREGHAAIGLLDGSVMLVGGNSGSTALGLVDVYNPVSMTWDGQGAPLHIRHDFTATALGSGKVLVAGGTLPGAGYTNAVEVYDTVADVWSQASSMIESRTWHAAAGLGNGMLLVAGGHNGHNLDSAEVYDPTLRQWTRVPPMSCPRAWATATSLPGGKVLIAGGAGAEDTAPFNQNATAEIFDSTTLTWVPAANLPMGIMFHSATLLADGNVLVAGGSDGSGLSSYTFLYNPEMNAWGSAGLLANPHGGGHTATLLPGGRVLIAGGDPANRFAELYQPATRTWTQTGPMTYARAFHTATLLGNGKVLVIGGVDPTTNELNPPAEVYDPATEVWSLVASTVLPRSRHRAVPLGNGKLLVYGMSPLTEWFKPLP